MTGFADAFTVTLLALIALNLGGLALWTWALVIILRAPPEAWVVVKPRQVGWIWIVGLLGWIPALVFVLTSRRRLVDVGPDPDRRSLLGRFGWLLGVAIVANLASFAASAIWFPGFIESLSESLESSLSDPNDVAPFTVTAVSFWPTAFGLVAFGATLALTIMAAIAAQRDAKNAGVFVPQYASPAVSGPGWYPSADGRFIWWDGYRWTGHVWGGSRAGPALGAPAAPPRPTAPEVATSTHEAELVRVASLWPEVVNAVERRNWRLGLVLGDTHPIGLDESRRIVFVDAVAGSANADQIVDGTIELREATRVVLGAAYAVEPDPES